MITNGSNGKKCAQNGSFYTQVIDLELNPTSGDAPQTTLCFLCWRFISKGEIPLNDLNCLLKKKISS